MGVKKISWGRFLDAANRGAISPRLQRHLWRGWYQLLARVWRDPAWTFMNYGFLPESAEQGPQLEPQDESQRCFIGLYHHLLNSLDLTNMRVLEIGSGRGGGASWIARYCGPRQVVGVDFSPAAVRFARSLQSGVPNLQFEVGDAESLPFADASFDLVINVESSHCYGNFAAFVDEVERVLVPQGYFCWADLRGPDMVATAEQAFARPGFITLQSQDINPGVIRALDAMAARKQERIERLWLGRSVMKQFAGMQGSVLYQGIKAGTVRYQSRIMQRRPLASTDP